MSVSHANAVRFRVNIAKILESTDEGVVVCCETDEEKAYVADAAAMRHLASNTEAFVVYYPANGEPDSWDLLSEFKANRFDFAYLSYRQEHWLFLTASEVLDYNEQPGFSGTDFEELLSF